MQKKSTINLHNISENIYLSFLAEVPFHPEPQDIQASYFGGNPLWLYSPDKQQCLCDNCNNKLTFLGQLYCPLNAKHCYHRILYILYCQKCQHKFRCIRQQASQQWKYQQKQLKQQMKRRDIDIKILSHKAFELENQSLNKKQLNKIITRTKHEIEQQRAIQEAQSEEQQDIDEEAMMQIKNFQQQKGLDKKFTVKQQENEIQNQQKNIDKNVDYVFEHYKKIMKQIQNPCMLYTDISIPYNNQPINPKHFCDKCGNKLQLQIQLTEQVLLMNNKQCSERLLLMDWGSILIYTCASSCKQSREQELIVQFQIDPINQENIKKLKKKKKNKKKSEQKAKSKSKSRSKSKQKETQIKTTIEQTTKTSVEQAEGDWD